MNMIKGYYRNLTFNEHLELFGMARIEVDPSFVFFPWKTFRKIANVNKQIGSCFKWCFSYFSSVTI